MKTLISCKHCGKQYEKKEVARVYGKESNPYLLGYCSARCYTTALADMHTIAYQFKVGERVVYDGIIAKVESVSRVAGTNTPLYSLVAEEDDELTCSAIESAITPYNGQEVDQDEALSNARLSSSLIAHQVDGLTDKYYRDGNH